MAIYVFLSYFAYAKYDKNLLWIATNLLTQILAMIEGCDYRLPSN
ncbi:hypothetical protein [Helicobacter sp. T3_23-1056]